MVTRLISIGREFFYAKYKLLIVYSSDRHYMGFLLDVKYISTMVGRVNRESEVVFYKLTFCVMISV